MNKRYSDKKLEWIPELSNGKRWRLEINGLYAGRIAKGYIGWRHGLSGKTISTVPVSTDACAAICLLESLQPVEPVIIEGDMWGRKN